MFRRIKKLNLKGREKNGQLAPGREGHAERGRRSAGGDPKVGDGGWGGVEVGKKCERSRNLTSGSFAGKYAISGAGGAFAGLQAPREGARKLELKLRLTRRVKYI